MTANLRLPARALTFVCALFACCAALAFAQAPTQPAATANAPVIVAPPPSADPGPRIIEAPQPAPPPRRRRPAPAPAIETLEDFASITDDSFAATSAYQGATFTVFGSVPDRQSRSSVVVALRGPPAPAVVRRKFRFLAFWVNGDPVRFEGAPSYLAVYTTRPLTEIATPRAIWELELDPAASAQLDGPTPSDTDASAYRRALVRLRREEGLYVEKPGAFTVQRNGLFHTEIPIPASAPLGEYKLETFLFRDRRLVQRQVSTVKIERSGIERGIHQFAQGLPLLYGITTVLIALAGGWIAAIVFRKE